jgi:hypothetical protein
VRALACVIPFEYFSVGKWCRFSLLLRSVRSADHVCNSFRLLVHPLAYASVVLFQEAVAGVPEVARANVSTLRQKLWKVAAVVVTSTRRVWLHLSASWPYRELWGRVLVAVQQFVGQVATG